MLKPRLQDMSAWERAQSAQEAAELRAAIEASLLDMAPPGEVSKPAPTVLTVPKSPAKASKVRCRPLLGCCTACTV